MSDKNSYNQRCEAMVQRGIEEAEDMEGIKFCTDECPYDCCIIFENQKLSQQLKAKGLAILARALKDQGVSRYDIALIIGKSMRVVSRYLKETRK